MKRIGERIKKQREKLELPLGDLARKVGITPSALSQIENSKSFPTIITLKSIAENIHTTVGDLIGENEPLDNKPVYQKSEKQLIEENSSGARVYQLTSHDTNKHMDTFLITLPASSSTFDLLANRSDQRFCHLIKGELAFELDNQRYLLNEGDSTYFNSKNLHVFINETKNETELLMIVSPPH